MSARDELPPGYFTRDGYIWRKRPGQNPEEQHTDRPDRYPVAWMRWETASGITREELATMRAAQEFTRVVCELLGNEGSGMDVSTDVLQDMLTAAGVTL
jgi:hypothetical protein